MSLHEQTETKKFCIVCRTTTENSNRPGHTRAIRNIAHSEIVGVALATGSFGHEGFGLPLTSQWVCNKCADKTFNPYALSVRKAMGQFRSSDVLKYLVKCPAAYTSFPVNGVTPVEEKAACALVVKLASSIAENGSNTHSVAVALAAINNSEIGPDTWKVLPTVTGQLVRIGTWPAFLGEAVGNLDVHVFPQDFNTRWIVPKTAVMPYGQSPVPSDFEIYPHIINERDLFLKMNEFWEHGAQAQQNLQQALAQQQSNSIEFARVRREREEFLQIRVEREELCKDLARQLEETKTLLRKENRQLLDRLMRAEEEAQKQCYDPLQIAREKFKEVFEVWNTNSSPHSMAEIVEDDERFGLDQMVDVLKTEIQSLVEATTSMEDKLRALEGGYYMMEVASENDGGSSARGHHHDPQQQGIPYHPALLGIVDPVQVVGHNVTIKWGAETFEGFCKSYSPERGRHWIVYNENESRDAEFVEIGPDDVIHPLTPNMTIIFPRHYHGYTDDMGVVTGYNAEKRQHIVKYVDGSTRHWDVGDENVILSDCDVLEDENMIAFRYHCFCAIRGVFNAEIRDIPYRPDDIEWQILILSSDLILDAAFLFIFIGIKIIELRRVFVYYLHSQACTFIDALERVKQMHDKLDPTEKIRMARMMGRHGPDAMLAVAKEEGAIEKLRNVPITKIIKLLHRSQPSYATMGDINEALYETAPALCATKIIGFPKPIGQTHYGIDWVIGYYPRFDVLRPLLFGGVKVMVTEEMTWEEAILVAGVQTGFKVRDNGKISSTLPKHKRLNDLIQYMQKNYASPYAMLRSLGLLELNVLLFSIVLCMDIKRRK